MTKALANWEQSIGYLVPKLAPACGSKYNHNADKRRPRISASPKRFSMRVSEGFCPKQIHDWCPALGHELLTDREIHLWHATLDRTGSEMKHLASLLSSEERRRAQQFRFEIDYNRFTVRRGILRTILARYLQTEPMAVAFDTGAHGKPALSQRFAKNALDFSLSHSQGESLIAVGLRQRIGVDIERIQPLPDVAELLNQCLSDCERKDVGSWILVDPLSCFYRYWTCKEAALKALGVGLTSRLDSVRVFLSSGESDAISEVQFSIEGPEPLFVRNFFPKDGYFAAAAFTHSHARFQYFAI
jgi:4'-phosphopantetheinyl transferase